MIRPFAPFAPFPHRPTYVELRAHSAFSFGEGACTPEALAAAAAALGYKAIGLTDCADLGGAIKFADACRKAKIAPVVGIELVVDGAPIALIARDKTGFSSIASLVTAARAGRISDWQREDGGAAAGTTTRGRPEVTWEQVADRCEGVFLLTGPTSSRLARLVARRKGDIAARLLARYRETFGHHMAVEVQLHRAGRMETVQAAALIALAEQGSVKWTVTGDPRYLDEPGRRAFDVLTALRHYTTIDDALQRGLLLPNDDWMLQAPEKVIARWSDPAWQDGLTTSAHIAEDCAFDLTWAHPPLPDFPCPEGHDLNSYLREQVYAGARIRWPELATDPEKRVRYEAQLDKELKVIEDLKFAGFFLVMHDATREARERQILCQGRGSSANSAVVYCLGISAVDPIKHGLLFERFLSAARFDGKTEAPDIDLDVEHDRREELLDYVYARYGRSHAAITAVTQLYSASTAMQDVGRAYDVPIETARALSKRLHHASPADGAELLRDGLAAAHGLDVTTPRGQAILAAIAGFEDLPRLRSTHPGGFVLSSAPLGDYCPIEPTTMGRTIIQFDKDDLDLAAIPKYDFLGLGSLAAVRRAFDVIEQHEGKRPELYNLPQDDPATFELIARGDTVGTFQIESRAQIASLVNTRPDKLYDIVTQVALIRPGPIVAKFVHPYTERRRGRAPITYPRGLEEALAPILDRTMGIPIFQEQAMAISMAVAGYTASEADRLRRTMGHSRKQARLKVELDRLRDSMIDKGVDLEIAHQLSDNMRVFANYGFPESHAWSFALIAYATCWLKAHRPTAFYIGLLNAQPMGFYSVATLVHDARKRKVEVRLPDLVKGSDYCTAEPSSTAPDGLAMRAGWRLVRGIGERAIDALVAARAERQFASIADAVKRAKLSRDEAGMLAQAQAFAHWEPDRQRAGWEALRAAGDTLPLAPAARGNSRKATPVGNGAPNDLSVPNDPRHPDHPRHPSAVDGRLVGDENAGWDDRDDGDDGDHRDADGFSPIPMTEHEIVAADYRAIGLSTAGHPAARYRAWAKRVGAVDSAALETVPHGTMVVMIGLVTVVQRPQTAKGVVFVLLEDEVGSTNIVCWPKIFLRYREEISHAPFIAVYGRVERDGLLVSVLAERMMRLTTKQAEDREAAEGEEAELAHSVHRFK